MKGVILCSLMELNMCDSFTDLLQNSIPGIQYTSSSKSFFCCYLIKWFCMLAMWPSKERYWVAIELRFWGDLFNSNLPPNILTQLKAWQKAKAQWPNTGLYQADLAVKFMVPRGLTASAHTLATRTVRGDIPVTGLSPENFTLWLQCVEVRNIRYNSKVTPLVMTMSLFFFLWH